MFPQWLYILSIVSLCLGGICSIIIIADVARHPQKMWIMNVVWVVTPLYSSLLALWLYYSYGRLSAKQRMMEVKEQGHDMPGMQKPFPAMVALGSTHCGAGCSLGDLCAEWLVFATAVTLWPLPNHKHIFASWFIDYGFAYAFGIVFQYFTIAPMRGLSLGKGIWAAIKADTLSLTAWQIGMYGWMAIASFLIFGKEIPTNSPVFWFMMQIAMLFGFATSYPINWWLLRAGWKEKM